MTQCRCGLEVVLAHLFTLATIVVCFAADLNTITVKISVRFFRFPSNTKEYKKWEVSIYQILIRQKRNDLYATAIVNKNLVHHTVCHLKMS